MVPSMDGTSMVGTLIRLAIGANHAICYYGEGSTVTNNDRLKIIQIITSLEEKKTDNQFLS